MNPPREYACGFCVYCGGIPSDGDGDHIIPRSWGGPDAIENYRRCCVPCNQLRADCGHCAAAMACVVAVVGFMAPLHRLMQVVHLWGWCGAGPQRRLALRMGGDDAVAVAEVTWPPMAVPAFQIKPKTAG